MKADADFLIDLSDHGVPVMGIKLDVTAALLRKGYSTPRDCLTDSARDDAAARWLSFDGADFVAVSAETLSAETPSLLLRSNEARAPEWHRLMGEVFNVSGFDPQQRQSQGAAIFVPCGAGNSRLVVWAFGTASRWLRGDRIDARFGLLVALNALSDPGLNGGADRGHRGAVAGTVKPRNGNAAKVQVSTIAPTSVGSFSRIDTSADALNTVTVRTAANTLGRLTGGSTVHFTTVISKLSDFAERSNQLLELAEREDYKSEHGWIDRIRPEEDELAVDEVLDEIVRLGNAAPVDVVWWHDVRDPDTDAPIDHWALQGQRAIDRRMGPDTAVHNRSLLWPSLLAKLKTAFPNSPGRDLLRKSIRFFDTSSNELGHCQVIELVAGQVDCNGTTYVLSDGQVYSVQADYIRSIDDDLTKAMIAPSFLPPYVSGKDEGTYNKRAAAERNHLLLDTKRLQLPGESAVEPADLLTADGMLVHVKVKSKSSAVGHLCNQAFSSARLLRHQPTARKQLLDQMTGWNLDANEFARLCSDIDGMGRRNSSIRVVVAIIGNWKGDPKVTNLPLLSRLALRACMQSVEDLGFEAKITLVGPAA